MDTKQFEVRKREHIEHSLNLANQASGLSGLEKIHLIHEALPEINFSEIDLQAPCLGRVLPTPFYVAGITAGHQSAFEVNRNLALACQARGWAMGVGSQRRDLEARGQGNLDQWRKLRQEVPDLLLFANIGMTQLISSEISAIRRLVSDLNAGALVVHLNALQEVIQVEGTPFFRGGVEALKNLSQALDTPLILKETGCGFSRKTIERLLPLKLAAIDVSGLGGTHWGRIEGARAGESSLQASAAQVFANWGEPTVDSVRAASDLVLQAQSPMEVWASGGVRSGLDAAKLIALGAHRVGYAQPALEAALGGIEKLHFWMEAQEYQLKTALFCTGSMNCSALRRKEEVWRPSVI